MEKSKIASTMVCMVVGFTGICLSASPKADAKTAQPPCQAQNAGDSNGTDVAMRAFELRMAGKVDEAKELLEKAVAQNPNQANAWFELSRVYFYMAPETLDLYPAQKSIKKAVNLDKENARFYYWTAVVATYKGILKMHSFWSLPGVPGQFQKSIDALEKAVKLKPDYRKARRELIGYYQRLPWYLGGSKSKTQKHEEMLAELGGDLDEQPEPDTALLDSALERIRKKEYELAEQKIREYLETNPVIPLQAHAITQLGRIRWLQGRKTEAEELKKQAEQLDKYYWPTSALPPQDLFVAP